MRQPKSPLPPNILPLTPVIKRAARTLARTEAKLLVHRLAQAKRMRQNFQRHITIAKRKEQEHVALDFLFTNWRKMESNIRDLLISYGQEHPAFHWMRSIGVSAWATGAMIACVDPTIRLRQQMQRVGFESRYRIRTPHATNFRGIRHGQMLARTEPYFTLYRQRKDMLLQDYVMTGKSAWRAMMHMSKIYIPEKAMYFQHANGLCRRGEVNANGWECGFFKFLPEEVTTLPPHVTPGYIHAAANTWAGKIFISHVHEVLNFVEYGLRPKPPRVHHLSAYIPPPNIELVPGLAEAPFVMGR